MTDFVIYPGMDDDYNFPTEVRQAMANSPEIAAKIALAGAGKISDTQKGVAGGVAQLDSGTKIPEGILPDRLSPTLLNATYVTYVDSVTGLPLVGKHVIIKVDQTTDDIADIIVEDI